MTFTTTETSKQNSTTTDNSSPLHHDDTEDSSTAPDTSRFQRDEREKFSNFYNGNRRNLNSGYGVTASRYSRGSHGRPHKNLRDTSLYREIRSKKNNDEYKTMYLQFSYDDILSLTKNLPATPEYESILKKAYESAESRKTKKTIEEQYDIRKKYQPTHGLVFKNIPKNTVRQDLFDAILAIPLMKKKDGEPRWTEHDFPGKCQMRSFMYPQKISSGDTRNAFPVFVDQRDRQTILNSIQDKNDRFNLPMKSKHSDDEVRSIQLIVEEVRGAESSSDNKESNSNDNNKTVSDNKNNNNNNNDQLTNSQHQKLNPRAQGFMPNNGQYQANPMVQNQMNYLPNNYHPGLYGQGYVNDLYNPYNNLQQQHQQTLTQFHRSNKFSNPNSVVNSGYEASKNPNTNSRRLEFKKPNEDQENNNNNNKSSQPHTPQPSTNNINNNQTVSMNGSNIIINNDINHRFDDTTGRDLSGASSPMSFTSNNSSNFQEQVLGQNKVFRPLNLKINNNNNGSVQTAVPNKMMDLFSNMNDQYTIGGNNMLASGTSSMGRDPQFSPFLDRSNNSSPIGMLSNPASQVDSPPTLNFNASGLNQSLNGALTPPLADPAIMGIGARSVSGSSSPMLDSKIEQDFQALATNIQVNQLLLTQQLHQQQQNALLENQIAADTAETLVKRGPNQSSINSVSSVPSVQIPSPVPGAPAITSNNIPALISASQAQAQQIIQNEVTKQILQNLSGNSTPITVQSPVMMNDPQLVSQLQGLVVSPKDGGTDSGVVN